MAERGQDLLLVIEHHIKEESTENSNPFQPELDIFSNQTTKGKQTFDYSMNNQKDQLKEEDMRFDPQLKDEDENKY